jgi:hypothetical protein
VFEGDEKDLLKTERLVKQAMISIPDPSAATARKGEPLNKKRKITDDVLQPDSKSSVEMDGNLAASILSGEKLSDLHIHLAQSILKKQFPGVRGLKNTVSQGKEKNVDPHHVLNKLQIIHSRGDHWIAASNIGCEKQVNVYDSAYSHLDEETEKVVCNLFQTKGSDVPIKIEMKKFQKQVGGTDCGLFSIAAITAIALNKDPSELRFIKKK